MAIDYNDLIKPEYGAHRAAQITDQAAAPCPETPPSSGTVYFCTADGEGNIPEESQKILRTVGDWLKTNGKSIFGAHPAPDFPYRLDGDFGCFTYNRDRRKLYMHILRYPAVPPHQICVVGLKTKVGKARLMKTGEEILCWQTYETARDEHRLRVRLPYSQPLDPIDTVVEIDVEDDHIETQTL